MVFGHGGEDGVSLPFGHVVKDRHKVGNVKVFQEPRPVLLILPAIFSQSDSLLLDETTES